jgi:hypothetical protein
MPERVADAIEEIARPNRDEPPEKPQIQADPARRRPRLIRNTPGVVLALLVVVAGVLAAWGTYWLLGFIAAPDSAVAVLSRVPVRVPIAVVAGLVVAGLVAWIFRPVQTLRRTLRSAFLAFRRRRARLPLFVAVAAAVLIGACLGTVASRAFSGVFFPHAATADEVLKAALPAVSGAAVAVALVIVFRRQKDSERARFAQRCGAASAQLGDSDVAVRVAGVYGMAAIADESSTFAHRQLCIDVLCGYLRLPYDPDWGSSHLSEFVSTTTWSATPPATSIEEQRRQAVRQNDREVRKTIVRVIARHLQSNADVSWSGNDFDFTDVLFEDASFAGATFNGRRVSFAGAAFRGENTTFEEANFHAETVTFHEARFESETTTFADANFRARYASFEAAMFSGTSIEFDGATFGGQYVFFGGASFVAGETSFASVRFTCLRASFESPAEWNKVVFDWDNAPAGSSQVPPRCITPRPWPPYLADEDLGSR